MVDLSIVLPAYNERSTIAASLVCLTRYLDQESRKTGRWATWEIVVVDDGSRDGTSEAARQAAPDEARLIIERLEINSGKGAAVSVGLSRAQGSTILVTDVDLSYAVADLGAAYQALRAQEQAPASEDLDMVTGDRRHPSSRMDLALSSLGHVVRRQAVSAVFNLGARWLYGLPWRDTQCGLKGFKREAAARILPKLRTRGFLADIEMLLIAQRLGLKAGCIPVHLTYLSGDSTVHVLRQLPGVLADAIRIKVAQIRRQYDGGE